MLEIFPVNDKKEQEKICSECGQEYNADAMCYSAYVDGELVGACQFVIREKSGVILSVTPAQGKNDEDALFIMGRQTLNFIDLCGVHSAFYSGDDNVGLIKRIGFKKDSEGKWFMDLTGFFEAPCKNDIS